MLDFAHEFPPSSAMVHGLRDRICPGSHPAPARWAYPSMARPVRWMRSQTSKGVEVGDTTLIHGEGKLVVGQGPVRTGVTVVFPRGRTDADPVYAGWFSQNGNGEMTGTTWVEESGFLEGPLAITNTHSVGLVRDSIIAWSVKSGRLAQQPWSLPVVAETWDGYLNDINGFHVQQADVFSALDTAKGGPVPEGNVGGGTGMVCYGFKGGDGTASRVLSADAGGYTVGVLVQCNCGRRPQLTIAGVPVGKLIPAAPARAMLEPELRGDVGSIIIVVATDAPLLPGAIEAACPPGYYGARSHRLQLGKFFRRYLHRLFYGQPRGRQRTWSQLSAHCFERTDQPVVPGYCRSNGRSHCQRHGWRSNHDRR